MPHRRFLRMGRLALARNEILSVADELPHRRMKLKSLRDEILLRRVNSRGERCSPVQNGKLTLASLVQREVAREARRRDCKKQKIIVRQSLTAYGGAPFTQGSLF